MISRRDAYTLRAKYSPIRSRQVASWRKLQSSTSTRCDLPHYRRTMKIVTFAVTQSVLLCCLFLFAKASTPHEEITFRGVVRNERTLLSEIENDMVFLPRIDSFSQKKAKPANNSMTLIYDESTCSGVERNASSCIAKNNTQCGLFLSLENLFPTFAGDQTGAVSLAPYLRRILERQEAGPNTDRTVYDEIKARFHRAARQGMVGRIFESDVNPRKPVNAHGRMRTISAQTKTFIPSLKHQVAVDRRLLKLAPCPLIGGWPLNLALRRRGGNSLVSEMHLMALPAQKMKNGSFHVPTPAVLLSSPVVAETNQLFLNTNKWIFKETVLLNRSNNFEEQQMEGRPQGSYTSTTTLYQHLVPEDQFNCTQKYIVICHNFQFTPRETLCLDWGSSCGVQTAIPLPRSEYAPLTHMLYIPLKTAGGDNMQRVLDGFESRLMAEIEANGRSEQALDQKIQSLEEVESSYLPSLQPEQDILTFTIIVLVFLSEWMLSKSLIASQLWRRLSRFANCQRSQNSQRHKEVGRYNKRAKKRLKQSCALLIPALTGFVPLVFGLAQARNRKYAITGTLAASWAGKPYRALFTGASEGSKTDNARAIVYDLQYTEYSKFDSMHTYYIVALWVASVLLSFSLLTIITQGILLYKQHSKKHVHDEWRKELGEIHPRDSFFISNDTNNENGRHQQSVA